MKIQSRKLLLHDYEDGPRTTTVSTSTLQPSDPLLSNTNTTTSSSTTTAKPFQPTLGFDSSMALTILVLLTALFFMVFFSMYLRRFAGDSSSTLEYPRRRRQRRSTSSSSSTSSSTSSSFSSCRKGLDPTTIKSLPLFTYDIRKKKDGDHEEDPEPLDCVVCLSEFEVKETVKMIPYCGHVFHQECIDMWFNSHVSCPLCRSTRLFGSSSVDKMAKKDDVDQSRKGFDVVVMERLSSTAENGDTCEEEARLRFMSVKRSKSWSRLLLGNEKVSLSRSSSF